MKLSRHIAILEIRNFQTHEDTTLHLHEGINILTGTNRAGKSAVLRAIRLLVYNQPRDIKSWIRHGKSCLFVRATMADGTWVAREKGTDINRYTIFDPSQSPDPIILDSVGTSVPPEIFRVIGIAPVSLAKNDGVELNIARQFDQAFMLSETDPDIARWLNSLTGLDDVRGAIDALSTDAKAEHTKYTAHFKRVTELETQLEAYAGLDDIVVELDDLAKVVAGVAAEQAALQRLQELQGEMAALRGRALPLAAEIRVIEDFTAALSEEEIDDLRAKLMELQEIETLAAEMCVVEAQLAAGADLNHKILMLSKMDFDALRAEVATVDGLAKLADQMAVTNEKLAVLAREEAGSQGDLRAIEEAIAKVKDELFADGDGKHCPLCGGAVDEDIIEHLMMESE